MSFRAGKGQLGKALGSLLGIKGTIEPRISDEFAPAITLGDIWGTPYSGTWPRFGSRYLSTNALAGEFSYVGLRAGAGSILELLGFMASASSGAAINFLFGPCATAFQSTVGFGGTPRILSASQRPETNNQLFLESFGLQAGTDAADQLLDYYGHGLIPLGSTIFFPYRCLIWGDSQVPIVGWRPFAVNTAMTLTVLVREWPIDP